MCELGTNVELIGDRRPRRGGTVRVGSLGASSDALNPLTTVGTSDGTALANLYDSLISVVGDKLVLALGEEITPNADATVWTIRVRPGVEFHDGRPLGAKDVAYSIKLLADPKQSTDFAQSFVDVDVANIKVVDDRTITVPLPAAPRPRPPRRDRGLLQLPAPVHSRRAARDRVRWRTERGPPSCSRLLMCCAGSTPVAGAPCPRRRPRASSRPVAGLSRRGHRRG